MVLRILERECMGMDSLILDDTLIRLDNPGCEQGESRLP
jgi:hypothetical protein